MENKNSFYYFYLVLFESCTMSTKQNYKTLLHNKIISLLK